MLIYNYFSNPKQRVKVNDSYSSWSEILFGIPQFQLFGILLFNMFICDMFYFMEDFNPIQDGRDGGGAGGQKDSPYQFFPCNFVTSTNVGFSP